MCERKKATFPKKEICFLKKNEKTKNYILIILILSAATVSSFLLLLSGKLIDKAKCEKCHRSEQVSVRS